MNVNVNGPRREVISLPTPSAQGKPPFKLLVVDSSMWRTDALRVVSHEGRSYHLRIVDSLKQFEKSLRDQWDLVMYSGYLEVWNDVTRGLPELAKAFHEGRIGGVVCNATLHKEGEQILKFLTTAGVPCAFLPFNWNNPSKRERVLTF